MNSLTSSSSPLLNQFTFSDEQLLSICETSEVLTCDCPAHLVGLLWKVRTFYRYITNCTDSSPEEVEMHRRLREQMYQMDASLSQVLLEFLQSKDLLDDQQQIDLKLLKERQLQAFLEKSQS